MLELLTEALDLRRPFVRVGPELDPGLHDVSFVGSTYGLPTRSLGSVGLLGPLRMDYEKAIRSVRAAAFELSRFVEASTTTASRRLGLLDGDDRRRLLRRARRRAGATDDEIKPAFRALARELHPDVSRRAGRAGAVPRGRRGLRGALQPETRELYDRYGHAGLRGGGFSRASSTLATSRISSRPSSGTSSSAGPGGRAAGGDVGVAIESSSRSVHRRRRGRRRGRGRSDLRALRGRGRGARIGARHLPDVRRPGPLQQVARSVFGEFMRTQTCPRAAARAGRGDAVPACGGAGRTIEQKQLEVEVPAGIHDGQRIRVRGGATPARTEGCPVTPTSEVRVAPRRGFERDGDDSCSTGRPDHDQAALGARSRCRRWRQLELRLQAGHPAGRGPGAARPGHAVAPALRRGDIACSSTSRPAQSDRRAARAARPLRDGSDEETYGETTASSRSSGASANAGSGVTLLRRVSVPVPAPGRGGARPADRALPGGLRGDRRRGGSSSPPTRTPRGDERIWQVFGGGRGVRVEAGWGEGWRRSTAGARRLALDRAAVGGAGRRTRRGRHRSGPRFGTGAHPTTQLCLDLLAGEQRGACSTSAAAPACSRSRRRARLRAGECIRLRSAGGRGDRTERRRQRRLDRRQAGRSSATTTSPTLISRSRISLPKPCLRSRRDPSPAPDHVRLPRLRPPAARRVQNRAARSGRRLGGRSARPAVDFPDSGELLRPFPGLQGLADRRTGVARAAASRRPPRGGRERRRRGRQHVLRHERGSREVASGRFAGGAHARAGVRDRLRRPALQFRLRRVTRERHGCRGPDRAGGGDRCR